MITADRLRELLSYDPITGVFRWRADRQPGRKSGDIAGGPTPGGYWHIGVDLHRYLAHRLAWLYVTGEWPTKHLDHKDLDGRNNAFSNLRQATDTQNRGNTRKRSDSTRRHKGVQRNHQKWCAIIRVGGQRHYLGTFLTQEEAHAAYCEAAAKYHGEFARVA